MVTRIAINGFGRIGRMTFRICLERDDLEVVAINDLTDAATLNHLLRYDSVYGHFPLESEQKNDSLYVNNKEVKIFSEKSPGKLPWKDMDIDVVVEATGVFRSRQEAALHLQGGARRVVVTAPMKDPDITIVMGVNEEKYDAERHFVVSNASCTTNALAPLAKILLCKVGIEKGLMNTAHAYTNDQRLLDLPHTDLRRARAAILSLIPTSTGAAKAVGEVIPELKGKIDGFAIRVPTPVVSLLDLVMLLKKEVTADSLNGYLQEGAREMKGILAYNEDPLVSSDYRQNPHSCIVDGLSTMVTGGNMARVVAWYDNEWGYSCRVADLAAHVVNTAGSKRKLVSAARSSGE